MKKPVRGCHFFFLSFFLFVVRMASTSTKYLEMKTADVNWGRELLGSSFSLAGLLFKCHTAHRLCLFKEPMLM